MIVLISQFKKIGQYSTLYYVSFGTVIGQVFFPVWFFQGMERMKYITYLNIGAKTFFTLCIFIFVKQKTDLMLVPLFSSLGFIATGVLSVWLIRKDFDIKFSWQSIKVIKFYLIQGWHMFFSSVAISFYTTSTSIVIGLLSNNLMLGYFTAADKLVQVVKSLYSPVSQAIYPLISKKIHRNKQSGVNLIEKTAWILCGCMFFISLSLFLFADSIVIAIFGNQFSQSVIFLKIMAFLPFLISLSNVFGVLGLHNLGESALVSKYIATVGTLHIFLIYFIESFYGAIGVASLVVFTEVIITALSIYYFRKVIKNDCENQFIF
jgi:PST family polysaccharide transporter